MPVCRRLPTAPHNVPTSRDCAANTRLVDTSAERPRCTYEGALFSLKRAQGRIGNLRPGDAGYAEAALLRASALFGAEAAEGNRSAVPLQGGGYYAFYLVQNSTSGQVLARNAANSLNARPVAFFSVEAANPDGFDHLRGALLDGRLELDWEDTIRGGDRDFDDARVTMELRRAPTALFTYQAEAEDADGDPLTYSLVQGPAGATIDPQTGLLRWNAVAGRHEFAIRVEDPYGGVAFQSFTLEVSVGNAPPAIDWTSLAGPSPASTAAGTWQEDFVTRLGQRAGDLGPNAGLTLRPEVALSML